MTSSRAEMQKTWKANMALNDLRYSRIQDELQTAEGASKEALLTEMHKINKIRYARTPWAEYMRNEDCIVGRTYAIWSRNLQFGVFRGHADGGFVGIREKFGTRYNFTEYHYDVGGMFGTVEPWVDLEECPIKDLRENLDTMCSLHNRPCKFNETLPSAGRGKWCHLEDGSILPEGDWPTAPLNQSLFDYLDDVRSRYSWELLMNTTRFKNEPDLQFPISELNVDVENP